MEKDSLFDFFDEEEVVDVKPYVGSYKIMIVDDDEQVHYVTKLMLKGFDYENYELVFIHAYSGEEAKKVLEKNPDVAVILLDVVMETNTAGLDVVRYLREELKYEMTRIILRTGQPGEAPEEKIIREYDINDYRLKTDLTINRLFTSLYVALRSYRYILRIEKNRIGLEKIIDASSNLFKNNSIEDFFKTILEQLSTFNDNPTELIYIQENNGVTHGFITMEQMDTTEIIAGTGKYEQHVGKPLASVGELKKVHSWIVNHQSVVQQVQMLDNGILIKKSASNSINNYIFIEGDEFKFDLNLINIFMTNYSIALDNYMLNNMITNTQSEIIITFADTIEKQFIQTDRHIDRISKMMYEFALKTNFSYAESEIIKMASTMHDIGSITIPDHILEKTDLLASDEFDIIRKHPLNGFKILSKSKLDIMKTASDIALSHHERFDGSGYPDGLRGKSIPLHARMMAIVDVFDAMTHNRVYKSAVGFEVALTYIKENKGYHFDPDLVDIFLKHFDDIVKDIL